MSGDYILDIILFFRFILFKRDVISYIWLLVFEYLKWVVCNDMCCKFKIYNWFYRFSKKM